MAGARWSKPALHDLEDIDLYYRRRDPDIADRIGDAALAAGRLLAAQPLLGPAIDGTTLRKWNVPSTPYILLYRPDDKGVRIIRVRHNRENWRP